MSRFSIRDLEQLSGIKAHTLRIWEQRYELLSPKRTDTNIRHYDDNDLRLVLNVALLKENGFKISKIAEMNVAEMQFEVVKLTERSLKFPEQVHALTLSMVDLDDIRFEKIITSNIVKLGFEKTMINVIYPFLSKIGILWQAGSVNPAQEHFITNLIRQKLIVAIDGQYSEVREGGKKFLLYLPEGEMHELSLLFANYLIISRGHRSLYLGQSLPFIDLKSVFEIHEPEYILTVLTTVPSTSEVQSYVDRLASSFPNSQILLSGFQIVGQDIKTPINTQTFSRFEQLVDLVDSLELQPA
ncbi:MAG: DNA-binding transcriptional MerR regulator [Marinoscillum sp.]|jgi:DNA-binding transcriptional MerR regulator